jgi:acyl-coenzyme A thioesterase PaaI-like protein
LKEKEKCLLPPVATVELNVKYHSNQRKTDLFIAENVSKITNQQIEVTLEVTLDLVEDLVMVEMIEMTEVLGLAEMTDQEKCILQHVATVEMNVKYHSNQKKTDLFIAENVSKIIKTSKTCFE